MTGVPSSGCGNPTDASEMGRKTTPTCFGWGAVNILNKQHNSSDCFQPPTTRFSGGFCLTKNRGKNNEKTLWCHHAGIDGTGCGTCGMAMCDERTKLFGIMFANGATILLPKRPKRNDIFMSDGLDSVGDNMRSKWDHQRV